ncbi:hypothetical protein [Agaribacterium sp. ZY112]|uniref:hypothetical protein n=1 Tax=Agaribacterium sp. ZY112 TaxID=3233574 RepID=UPI003525AA9D
MNIRKFYTPLTIGSFLVASASGMLIFFEMGPGSVRATHEWLSVVFWGLASFISITTKSHFLSTLPIIVATSYSQVYSLVASYFWCHLKISIQLMQRLQRSQMQK